MNNASCLLDEWLKQCALNIHERQSKPYQNNHLYFSQNND